MGSAAETALLGSRHLMTGHGGERKDKLKRARRTEKTMMGRLAY